MSAITSSGSTTSACSGISVASCPDCGAGIELSQSPIVGEIVSCPDCSAELELRGMNPIQLAAAPQLEEDWGE